jgi:hypothetical protein
VALVRTYICMFQTRVVSVEGSSHGFSSSIRISSSQKNSFLLLVLSVMSLLENTHTHTHFCRLKTEVSVSDRRRSKRKMTLFQTRALWKAHLMGSHHQLEFHHHKKNSFLLVVLSVMSSFSWQNTHISVG